jgi:beta-glucanase (GH16 family)
MQTFLMAVGFLFNMSEMNTDFIEFQDHYNYSDIWGDVINDPKFYSPVDDSCKKLNGIQTDMYLVWSDEFDGTELDTTKWHFEIFGSCWDNVHWNTDSPNNTNLSDGKLHIIARKDSAQTSDEKAKACDGIHYYTSSYIVTQNKADWQYGRIEALIKLPNVGQGFVPAFWMKPADEMYGWWPYSGSIEIMEHPTNQIVNIFGTIDTKVYSFLGIGSPETHSIQIPDAETAFHTYAIEWSEEQIDFYVDTNKYFSYLNDHTGFETWPFDQAFYAILDISVGGGWVGNPDEYTVFPAIMEVEYVRAYQKLEDIHITGPDVVTPNSTGISYSLPLLNDANYSWTISPGAQIVSGQGTNQILVDWGEINGNVGGEITVNSNSHTTGIAVEVTANLIKNAGFEKGGKYWNSNITTFNEWNQPRGSYEFISSPFSHTDQSIKINIPALLDYAWDFQLSQIGFPLKNKKEYNVSFWAKSDVSGNKISATIVIPKNLGKANYVLYGRQFILTDQWAQYSFSFAANDNTEGALNIDMGYQVGTNCFDDFSLLIKSNPTGWEASRNPEHYVLSQNYPNPCSSTTLIEFSLPYQQMATLKVYDIQGHEIAVLVNEVKQPGSYTITFNTRELSDGFYFYQFIAGEFVQTRQCIVLK